MLEELGIRGLGVIAEAVLEPAPGLTVLTGETGAGKTMVLSGLGLLLGGRADSELIRPADGRTEVHGRVRLATASPALAALAEMGVEFEDGVLLLSRTVSSEGRSRCYVGGRPVPASVLARVAEELVTVHGQSDQHRLLRPAEQRAALDRFAGAPVATAAAAYQSCHARWSEQRAELEGLQDAARTRAQESDLLRHGLDRIAAVAPQPGEDRLLAVEVERLSYASLLREAAAAAHVLLTGEMLGEGTGSPTESGDAGTAIAAATRALRAVEAHDPTLAELADRLTGLGAQLADVGAELASYAGGVEADPAALAAAQDRQAALGALTRLYGQDADEMLGWADRARVRLAELDQGDARAAGLAAQVVAGRAELAELAGVLSLARQEAAVRFGAAVSAELRELAMPAARVEAVLSHRIDPDGLVVPALVRLSTAGPAGAGQPVAFGRHGVDEVELRLTAHPGTPSRPLQRGASGGELSRVMLAVEVTFAGTDPVPTMVFDEVDAGVGGAAAVEVGRRLARLARDHQVLCVTHLAQVAAFADRHLLVAKTEDGTIARTGVRPLEDIDRVRELSRMLAGLADSTLAQGHAEELLALAAAGRLV